MAQNLYTTIVPFLCRNCPRNCECFEHEAIKAELKDFKETLAIKRKKPKVRKLEDIIAVHSRYQVQEEIHRVGVPEKLDYLWTVWGEMMSAFQSQNCGHPEPT